MPRSRTWLRTLLFPAIRRGRALARDDEAAVAIEFAILALPFFTIIFAILETALVFLAGQVLESAVQDSSRLVLTGQAQAQGYNAEAFRAKICERLYGMFDCSQLRIIVDVIEDFDAASLGSPIGSDCTVNSEPEDCDWTIADLYEPGTGSDIVLVKAFYKWPTLVNLPGFNLANQAGNKRLLSGVRVFRNEPFTS